MPVGQHGTKLKAKELDAFSHVGRIYTRGCSQDEGVLAIALSPESFSWRRWTPPLFLHKLRINVQG